MVYYFPIVISYSLITLLSFYYIGFFLIPSLNGSFEETLNIPNPWNDLDDDEYDKYAGKANAEILFIVFVVIFINMLASVTRTIITSPGTIPDEREWDMVSEVSRDDIDPAELGSARGPTIEPEERKTPTVGRPVIGKPLNNEGIQEAKANNTRSARRT